MFENLSDEITIYCEHSVVSTFDELEELCTTLNNKHSTHIFLPDHPHRETFIKGIKTGNDCTASNSTNKRRTFIC